MLLYTNRFANSMIVRTRDSEVLKTLDTNVDVGGVYDPETLRYDHHQSTFKEVWDPENEKTKGIKLSSAGLVYRHYGREFIKNMTKHIWNQDLSEDQIEYVYPLLYKKLILEVDAIDNGVSEAENMKYFISSGLASRVARMNPDWQEPTTENTQHVQFKKCLSIAEEELAWKLKDLTQSRMKAYEIVKEQFDRRFNFHESGELLLLKSGCPWKSSLLEIEKNTGCEGQIKFVFFPDLSGSAWRISTVPPFEGSFEQRVGIKKEWCGLRDSELAKVSGVEDAIFVHANAFIGGAKSQASVVKMALDSIAAHNALKK